MAEDRSKEKLVIYAKDGTKVSEGTIGSKQATIPDIPAGTVVAAGDYKCTFSDGTNESETTDVPGVTVPAAKVPVMGVTVTPETASIEVGKTTTIAETVAPDNATDKSGKWASKDATIVTIDDKGVVTGVKAGTTEVNFTTTDGSQSAAAEITVTEPAG